MATTNTYFNLVQTGNSTWAAVHTNNEVLSARDSFKGRTAEESSVRGTQEGMFEVATEARAAFTERFPRLTIAMISIALFAVSVTAEMEWLHQAGYYWR
ncbi:MAG TPA: hypothetical protein VK716_14170 [Terracidiphilus sp.]|jgi:hypothetical protein|nr:hypothetical protein [Terracidiphilus sp.]